MVTVDGFKPAVFIVEHTLNCVFELINLALAVQIFADAGEIKDVHRDKLAQLFEVRLHILITGAD